MQRYIAGLFLALFLSGCAQKSLTTRHYESARINDYLFKAVFLEYSGGYNEAAKWYEKLYETTKDDTFLTKTVENLLRAKKYEKALSMVEAKLRSDRENILYNELAARLYLAKKEYEKAKEHILKALQQRKNAKDYELLASIYMLQKEYAKALKYYKSAYSMQPTPHRVNSIAYIMYFYLDKPKEAVAYLETYSRIYGCERSVCKTLASLYGSSNDIEGLVSVYKRLYETYEEPLYARKLVELYVYQKKYDEAIEYVKRVDDEELLLDLYKAKKDFKKAKELAMRLYEETKDPKFLAQNAIFTYEASSKKDPATLKEVASKLEKVIKELPDPLYLNYLGYLYIDHDIDVKRGIELVKQALQKEPNSPYYLDSLAWGYYKIKKCQKALKLIKRVYYDLGFKDPEVKYHLQKIEECMKEKF